ncbi:hypothetical protein UKMH10_3088 [Burkholderia pseudomallei]|nr:hypothetical protein BPC006_I3483 [Burkholderia pseudomallei BPC006]VUD54635.1 hypothetical protein UKMH10_3088 [Burkholderia pseudomallei]
MRRHGISNGRRMRTLSKKRISKSNAVCLFDYAFHA